MITRSDFNEDAFDELFSNALIEQLDDFRSTMDEDSISDSKIVEALRRVIAYNSVPGTYEDGKYDL